MTIVVFWRQASALQVVADSRISGQNRVYTDAGPKILLLQMRVLDSVEKTMSYRTYGFAYAGSALAALSAYANVANSIANLKRTGKKQFPSVREISSLFEKAANRYIEESNPPSVDFRFEALVFGACQTENKLVGISIDPQLRDGRWRAVLTRAPLDSGQVIGMLGQSKSFLERLNAWEGTGRGFDPHGVIDEMIRDPNIPTVGGSRQMAIALPWDVEIIPVGELEDEGPKMRMLITGNDVSETPLLDGFVIGHHIHYRSAKDT